jgi:predicted glutamine amidotransferase
MCELFAMSARFPTTVHLSLEELARHGGGTGPHRDGWGLAFAEGGDALVVREPGAANGSPWIAFLQHSDLRSSLVVAHIRRATQGPRLLRNTQPFGRELGGRVHLFAHNGMLAGVEAHARFPAHRFLRIGETDSEHAFCALLERLAPRWERGLPSLDERLAEVVAFAAELRALGPANFLYADGDALFAHGHRRTGADGVIRPPGLHLLCRSCAAGSDGVPLAGISIAPEARQEVALLASVPLSSERWEPLVEGEVVVLREGRVARRALPAGAGSELPGRAGRLDRSGPPQA